MEAVEVELMVVKVMEVEVMEVVVVEGMVANAQPSHEETFMSDFKPWCPPLVPPLPSVSSSLLL